MINPKEKAALQEMWGKSETAGTDIPDGTYQFIILSARFHMSDKGKPQFKTKVRVKGGAEEYVGKELEINDNLETPENMGWFKKKLARLNISTPEDFDEIVDGTLAEQMVGKVFEGQAKTKNDFLNIYVNRLLGEARVEPEAEPEDDSEDSPEAKQPGGFDVGDVVTWRGHTGTVIEQTDDGKYRVKAEDKKVYRVAGQDLSPADAEQSETEEQDHEDAEGGDEDSVELPTPEDVESLPATEVKKLLKDLGLDAAKVKTPRAVLHGIATLAADPKAKIDLTEVKPLAEALDVSIGKDLKANIKSISSAVQELIGA